VRLAYRLECDLVPLNDDVVAAMVLRVARPYESGDTDAQSDGEKAELPHRILLIRIIRPERRRQRSPQEEHY
jgi:hypothetical protein